MTTLAPAGSSRAVARPPPARPRAASSTSNRRSLSHSSALAASSGRTTRDSYSSERPAENTVCTGKLRLRGICRENGVKVGRGDTTRTRESLSIPKPKASESGSTTPLTSTPAAPGNHLGTSLSTPKNSQAWSLPSCTSQPLPTRMSLRRLDLGLRLDRAAHRFAIDAAAELDLEPRAARHDLGEQRGLEAGERGDGEDQGADAERDAARGDGGEEAHARLTSRRARVAQREHQRHGQVPGPQAQGGRSPVRAGGTGAGASVRGLPRRAR